jgi:two-component system response regulator PilR (NtrC family)
MRLPDGSGIDLIGEISQRSTRHAGGDDHRLRQRRSRGGSAEGRRLRLRQQAGRPRGAARPGASTRWIFRRKAQARREHPARARAGHRLVGDSPAMQCALKQTHRKVARSQAPVYIAGESGVGKELVARTDPRAGRARAGPFVPVNCGAIPPN